MPLPGQRWAAITTASAPICTRSQTAAASAVPHCLPACPQLRRLELSDAGLSHLPASIAGMSRLEALVARRLGMEWGVDGCWQPKTEAHPAGYRCWA